MCLDEFPLFYITQEKGVFSKAVSGVLGLARPRKFMVAPEMEIDKNRLIVHALGKAKKLESTTFVISFSSTQTSDEVTDETDPSKPSSLLALSTIDSTLNEEIENPTKTDPV